MKRLAWLKGTQSEMVAGCRTAGVSPRAVPVGDLIDRLLCARQADFAVPELGGCYSHSVRNGYSHHANPRSESRERQ